MKWLDKFVKWWRTPPPVNAVSNGWTVYGYVPSEIIELQEREAAVMAEAKKMPGDGPGWPTQATYTVEEGDTLIEIGKKVEVPWRTLAVYNRLENRDLIKPGDTLLLPWLEYTVGPGDFLGRIAVEHGRGNTWQTLAYYNGLEKNPDLIHPGDVIRIPV